MGVPVIMLSHHVASLALRDHAGLRAAASPPDYTSALSQIGTDQPFGTGDVVGMPLITLKQMMVIALARSGGPSRHASVKLIHPGNGVSKSIAVAACASGFHMREVVTDAVAWPVTIHTRPSI